MSLSDKINNGAESFEDDDFNVISVKDVKEAIKELDDKLVDCDEFRDWEKSQPQHYISATTVLSRFIYWFKRYKFKEIFGKELTEEGKK